MATIPLPSGGNGMSWLKSDTNRAVSDRFASVKNVNDLFFSSSGLKGGRKILARTKILAVKSSERIQSANKSNSSGTNNNNFPSLNGPATTLVSSPSLKLLFLFYLQVYLCMFGYCCCFCFGGIAVNGCFYFMFVFCFLIDENKIF